MIYLLHGKDFVEARKKLHSLLDSLFEKKPNASFFKMDSSNFTEGQLDEFISGQGLFEQKYIVQMDGLLEDKKAKDIVLDRLKEISGSDNVFVFIEDKITKPVLKKISDKAQKVQEFDSPESLTRKFGVAGDGELDLGEFNIFNMADALGNRDKKNLWVLYQKAKAHNIPAEEMHGILLWQVKSIALAKNSANAESSGLKPFVFSKSLRFAKNFENEELKNLSSKMISIYHDARRGIVDFDTAMELFVLEL